ncbi:Alpha/Beta hydrolase protein [Chaetomidium leptoderma]|uniref:Alpha/Beta hydrolase protein n=1 Tax=Chaetomidium leptoderma TaxID=669021 RepID=A0AAN6VFR1_9PEZI|nr:Alpha/Beta hydrolase protein [Chaetomidium leptoderma]
MFHLSLPPSPPSPNAPTILLLHGALSSHLQSALVTPHLQSYHVLVPDLPGHARSSALTPATIPSITDRVACLIRAHARDGGRAHVADMSMGGFVALDLARRYPELCLSAFLSGATPFVGGGVNAFLARHTWVLYYGLFLVNKVMPDGVYWWMCRRLGLRRHEALRREMCANTRWTLVQEVYGSILGIGWEEIRAVDRVRCLAVAGGKQDQVDMTKRMGEVWKKSGNVESRAVVVKEAVHAWDLQMPELLADGIKSWVEETELPEEFEALD